MLAPAMQRVEGRERLHAPDAELLRGFAAPAPLAAKHLGDRHAMLPEGIAHSAGLSPPRLVEVSLRAASADAEIGRIARAGRPGVAHQGDVPAARERLP